MKLSFNHIPRRFWPTPEEAQEIRAALLLRGQLPPGDPNHLVPEAAVSSWGGAFWLAIGHLWQDRPAFLVGGTLALVYVALANFNRLVAEVLSW